VARFRGRVVTDGTLSAVVADRIAGVVRQVIVDAVVFGLASPFPELESAREHVYA
jgi:hypothetical protein